MGFFTPHYLKEARNLIEGASKTLHHYRDILRMDQCRTLEQGIAELREAVSFKDRPGIEKFSTALETSFSSIIPANPHAAWTENVEAIIVAVALAVGFQAYFLKPFKIPTGSMQPTLYGMTGHPTSEQNPPPLARIIDFVQLGRTHLDLKASRQEEILDLQEQTKLNFFTFTDVTTTAGTHKIFAPRDVLARDFGIRPGRVYEAGDSIVHGYVQAGDQVFVDRMTYQFQNPKSSDVFVFTTKGIRKIEMGIDPALGSQFYIKRLAGVPGMTLRIDSPNLFLNEVLAASPQFQRVMTPVGTAIGDIPTPPIQHNISRHRRTRSPCHLTHFLRLGTIVTTQVTVAIGESFRSVMSSVAATLSIGRFPIVGALFVRIFAEP